MWYSGLSTIRDSFIALTGVLSLSCKYKKRGLSLVMHFNFLFSFVFFRHSPTPASSSIRSFIGINRFNPNCQLVLTMASKATLLPKTSKSAVVFPCFGGAIHLFCCRRCPYRRALLLIISPKPNRARRPASNLDCNDILQLLSEMILSLLGSTLTIGTKP